MPTSKRRTAAKVIYFHPEELVRVTARAQACGQTLACFIRETALGTSPKAADPLLSELTLIGRRLDQIARLPQAGHDGALAEQVRAALDRHWALVRRILADRRQGGGASRR
jgi:mobilization protein NikA